MDGYTILVEGKTKARADELEMIMNLTGATIVTSPQQLVFSDNEIVICDDADKARSFERKHRVKPLPLSWLLDCIVAHKVLPPPDDD